MSQHAKVHAGRVGEEQERQRYLSEAPERLAVHVDVDHRQRVVGEHESESNEGHRGTHVEGLEARREESPHHQRPRDGHDQARVETLHPLLLRGRKDH